MGWIELFEAAATRGGVVAPATATEHGVSVRALQRRASREQWHRPQPNALVLPGIGLDFRGHAHAALASAGPRSLVAGRAALHLHGVGRPPLEIDVVVPVDRDIDLRPPARARRSRTLLADDAVEVDGIRATSPARSILDVAAWEDADAAVDVLLDACQRRTTTARQVRRRAEQRSPLRNRGRIVRACDLVEAGIESAFERRVLPLLSGAGIPPPVPQAPVDADGRRLRVDFGWPALRVGVECLGLRYHNDREAMRRDVHRMNALGRADWRIVWVEWEGMLKDPTRIVTDVRQALIG